MATRAVCLALLCLALLGTWPTTLCAQPPPAASTGAAPVSAAEEVEQRRTRTIAGFAVAAEIARDLTEWALLAFGGTFLLIFSAEYRPLPHALRVLYLLFPLAWVSLAWSLNAGMTLQRSYAALLMRPPSDAATTGALVLLNSSLATQLNALYCGLAFLAVWLLAYVALHIFGGHTTAPE